MKFQKKESILSTARKLFMHYGVQKTNIEEIARLAKVAKATVYNYFGGKEQILVEVLERELSDFIIHLSSAVAEIATPLEKLHTFLFTSFHLMQEKADILNLHADLFERVIPSSGTIHKKLFREQANILRGILTEGVATGDFANADRPTIRSILYAIRGFEFTWLLNRDNIELDRDLQGLYDLICKGLVKAEGVAHA